MNGELHGSDVAESWRDWLSDLFGIAAVVFVLMFLFSGCGGGTSGTGIRNDGQVVQGLVRTTDGSPIPGVVVTIIETNDQAVTDSTGAFEIPVGDGLGDFTVEFSGQGVDSEVAVGGVPDEATSVDVSVTIDDQTGQLSGTSVEIAGENMLPPETPSPTPAPTPDPSIPPAPSDLM